MTSNLLRHPKSRYSEWDGPDLNPSQEALAARTTFELLNELQAVYEKAHASEDPLHWVRDLGPIPQESRRYLLNTLGKGEVRISLYDNQAQATETKIPGLWRLLVGSQESLVAAVLPRCVNLLLDQGLERIPIPEKKPESLFAAIPIINEINAALATADLTRIPETAVTQIDMVRQPMTPADKNFILTTLGTGPISIELVGFADSRILSTKVRGVWRTIILNPSGKTLLHSLSVARIPPEVPAASEDFSEALDKIREIQDWLSRDLERIQDRKQNDNRA